MARSKKDKAPEALPETINERNAAEAAVWRAFAALGRAYDWKSPQTLADVTGLSVSTVNKQLKTLAEKGLALSKPEGRGRVWARPVAGDPVPGDRADQAQHLIDSMAQDGDGVEAGPIDKAAIQTHAPIDSLLHSGAAQDDAQPPQAPGVAETTGEEATAGSDDVNALIKGLDELGALIEDMQSTRPVSAPPAAEVAATEEAQGVNLLTADEARSLTDAIKRGLSDLLPQIKEAFVRRADLALGYRSWTEYCDTELQGVRMPVAQRQAAVRELAVDAGMSTRAIAGALGTSDATVRRDLDATGGAPTGPVTGLDGKAYTKPAKPAKAAKAPREVPGRVGSSEGDPLPAAQQTVPVERDNCGNCHTLIVRRLDAPGDQWRHDASGVVECDGMPGMIAEPWLVPDAPSTVEQANLATGTVHDDGRVEVGGGVTTDVQHEVPLTDREAALASMSDVEADAAVAAMDTDHDSVLAVAAALREFPWDEYEIGPEGWSMPVGETAAWVQDLAEAIVERLGL